MRLEINNSAAGEAVAQISGCRFVPGEDVCFSTHRADGAFLGGLVLTDYNGATMTIHIGSLSDKWLTRDMLWVFAHYPFVQLGCRSLIGPIPRSKVHALSFALKVGFEVDTIIKDYLPGNDDLVVTRMWRDKCRWLHTTPRNLRCGSTFMGA